MKDMEEEKRSKTKIKMGSSVTAKIGDMEENNMDVSSRRMRKEVLGCGHDVVGNNKLLVKFEDG